MKILAIESSCDETSIAIVEDGKKVLSNVTYTQIEIHKQYGGVVPEVASRHHIEKVTYVLEGALQKANITLEEISFVKKVYTAMHLRKYNSIVSIAQMIDSYSEEEIELDEYLEILGAAASKVK